MLSQIAGHTVTDLDSFTYHETFTNVIRIDPKQALCTAVNIMYANLVMTGQEHRPPAPPWELVLSGLKQSCLQVDCKSLTQYLPASLPTP